MELAADDLPLLQPGAGEPLAGAGELAGGAVQQQPGRDHRGQLVQRPAGAPVEQLTRPGGDEERADRPGRRREGQRGGLRRRRPRRREHRPVLPARGDGLQPQGGAHAVDEGVEEPVVGAAELPAHAGRHARGVARGPVDEAVDPGLEPQPARLDGDDDGGRRERLRPALPRHHPAEEDGGDEVGRRQAHGERPGEHGAAHRDLDAPQPLAQDDGEHRRGEERLADEVERRGGPQRQRAGRQEERDEGDGEDQGAEREPAQPHGVGSRSAPPSPLDAGRRHQPPHDRRPEARVEGGVVQADGQDRGGDGDRGADGRAPPRGVGRPLAHEPRHDEEEAQRARHPPPREGGGEGLGVQAAGGGEHPPPARGGGQPAPEGGDGEEVADDVPPPGQHERRGEPVDEGDRGVDDEEEGVLAEDRAGGDDHRRARHPEEGRRAAEDHAGDLGRESSEVRAHSHRAGHG